MDTPTSTISISEMMKNWVNQLEEDENEKDKKGCDITLDQWSPKVKWFRPPMWKIFSWAYNHKCTLMRNCYPVACKTTGIDQESCEDAELPFAATRCTSANIEEIKKSI